MSARQRSSKRILLSLICGAMLCVQILPAAGASKQTSNPLMAMIEELVRQISGNDSPHSGTVFGVDDRSASIILKKNSTSTTGTAFDLFRWSQIIDDAGEATIGYPRFIGTVVAEKVLDGAVTATIPSDANFRPQAGDYAIQSLAVRSVLILPILEIPSEHATALSLFRDVLANELEQTGRFTVDTTSDQTLEKPSFPFLPDSAERSAYLAFDLVVSLALTERGPDWLITGTVFSIGVGKTVSLLAVEGTVSPLLSAMLSLGRSEKGKGFIYEIRNTRKLPFSVLDMTSADMDHDGKEELLLLGETELLILQQTLSDDGAVVIPLPSINSNAECVMSGMSFGNIETIHDTTSESPIPILFIRTSTMATGHILTIENTKPRVLGTFDGYPVANLIESSNSTEYIVVAERDRTFFHTPLSLVTSAGISESMNQSPRFKTIIVPESFRDLQIVSTVSDPRDLFFLLRNYQWQAGTPDQETTIPPAGYGSSLFYDRSGKVTMVSLTGLTSPDEGDMLDMYLAVGQEWTKVWSGAYNKSVIMTTHFLSIGDRHPDCFFVEQKEQSTYLHRLSELKQ